MKTFMFSAVAAFAVAGSFADATIGRVLVRQQWPWDEKVAIDFVLTNVTSATEIDCAVYRGATPVSVSVGAFTGDICELAEDGAYRIMFDPSYLTDRPAKGETLRFELTPSAMTGDSPNREVLYKIFDLVNHTVTDVTRGALLSGQYGSVETDYSRIGEGYSSPLSDVLIWTGVTNYPGAKTTKLVMRKIPAGDFDYPQYGDWTKATKYTITVSKPFYIGVFELTQKQFSYFPNATYSGTTYYNPGELSCNLGDDKPVQNIAVHNVMNNGTTRIWDASKGALKNLKEMFAGAGTYNFDLPTIAMWYRAMRAESTTYYYDGIAGKPDNYDNNERMAALGRFAGTGGIVDNGDGTTTSNGVVSVGLFRPNAFGLYDMIGNVSESTKDHGQTGVGQHYSASETDPVRVLTGNAVGLYGNDWRHSGKLWTQPQYYTNLHASYKYPHIGVRLAFFEGENPFKPSEE